jgi:hypothetical protein
MQLTKSIYLIAITLIMSGCATSSNDQTPYDGYEDDYTVYEDEYDDNAKIANEKTLREATEQVVMEIRGVENAKSYINYQKPLVQCGVMIPGRMVGSSIITPSEGCIVNAPGAFVESNTYRLPLEGEEK